MNGIGERAGNCSLEEVIMAIKVRKDILNVHTAINHQEIWRTSQLVSQICNMPIPANKAIVGSGAFAHSSVHHESTVSHYHFPVRRLHAETVRADTFHLASPIRDESSDKVKSLL